jgi:hypothetical protein
MTYKTIQAYLQDNVVNLPKNILPPKKKVKILITFIEDEYNESIDYNLYELPKEYVSKELNLLSKNALKKNKSLFTNI